ncbi:MAG: hypothetical protein K6F04_02715 [bacterium]|nr:hypothetical protein [bacterium]
MRKNLSKKKPVETTIHEIDELALNLFAEYADGRSDILLINDSKNLLFLNDYQYTLQLLRANNSPSERFKRILEDDFLNSL